MTKKYVLTGGASCGKTSLLNELRKRGFCTIEESATEVIEDRLDIPISLEEILKRQLLIFKRQVKRESYEFPSEVFLDRSLIDSFSYCQSLLGDVPTELKNFPYPRYDQVFLLERMPLVLAEHRIEKDDSEVEKNHQALVRTYSQFGYDPVFVPVMPVEKRAEFILDYLRRSNGLH
jgi:predicted ATPase